jgi:hypothetical protein
MPHQLKEMQRFENPNFRQQTLSMWLLQPRKLKCHLPISIQATKTDTTRFVAPGQVPDGNCGPKDTANSTIVRMRNWRCSHFPASSVATDPYAQDESPHTYIIFQALFSLNLGPLLNATRSFSDILKVP